MKYNQSIIAIKQSHCLNATHGFVTPIAKEIDEGTYIPVEDHEFPNNRRIWVSKDYDILDDKFDYGEPFKVLEYNEDSESLYKRQENKEQYWMKGNDTEALQKNEIYVIIKSNLPKVETPYLDTVPNISNLSQHIFLEEDDSQYLYGPFDVSKTDEGFKISPSTINTLNLRSDHIYKISKKNISHLIISHNSLDMSYIISADKIKTEVQFE